MRFSAAGLMRWVVCTVVVSLLTLTASSNHARVDPVSATNYINEPDLFQAPSNPIAMNSGRLDVHSGPGPQYPLLTSVPSGTVLPAIRQSGAWTQVLLPFGRLGWVAAHREQDATAAPSAARDQPVLAWENAYVEVNDGCLGLGVVVDARLFVPLRETVQRLGGTTEWSTDVAIVRFGGRETTVQPGHRAVAINDRQNALDAAPVLIPGELLVPAFSFFEPLGLAVTRDSTRQTVRISGAGAGDATTPCNPPTEAESYILLETKTGVVLAEQGADSTRTIASTTKIMTALLALERGQLDDVVTVSQRAATTRGSTAELRAGEQIALEQLLRGLILPSGNDAAVAIAEHIAGSEYAFAQEMTRRAEELGATHTVFFDASGLTSRSQSTARDLALIARHAMHNPDFRALVSIPDGTMTGSFGTRSYTNGNQFLHFYRGATGIKNGWTPRAGYTLVASASDDGVEILLVLLGAVSRDQLYQQSEWLMDQGFGLSRSSWLLGACAKNISITADDADC